MRSIGIVAGSAAITLAVVLVASPAAAATLPLGQRISAASNSGLFADPATTQLFDVNPATAAGTAVGSPSTSAFPIFAIDVDDDGHGFATSSVQVDDETSTATLWALDANTGTYSSSVTINVPMLGSDVFCPSVDYSGGRVLITCNQETDESFVTILGSVNPSTGDVDVILAIEDESREGEFTEFTALATSPAGVLWAFGFDDVAPFAAIVDLGTETLGDRLPIINDGDPVDGADFARDGQLFASVRGVGNAPTLSTVNLTTGAVALVAPYSFASPLQSATAITVWGRLAATGSAGSELVLPLGMGSVLLLLAGAAFVATSRVSRRTSA
jgi:hypothetical protein